MRSSRTSCDANMSTYNDFVEGAFAYVDHNIREWENLVGVFDDSPTVGEYDNSDFFDSYRKLNELLRDLSLRDPHLHIVKERSTSMRILIRCAGEEIPLEPFCPYNVSYIAYHLDVVSCWQIPGFDEKWLALF